MTYFDPTAQIPSEGRNRFSALDMNTARRGGIQRVSLSAVLQYYEVFGELATSSF